MLSALQFLQVTGEAVVPVSIIASFFGFFAIGTGLFYRRKSKKA
jgi:hypothetical protein